MSEVFGFPRDAHTYSAADVGKALSGLFERTVGGIPKVGMLTSGPTLAPVSGAFKVLVGVFTYVHQVAGSVQLSGISAAMQVDITPAAGNIPAGQARIDLICWDQNAGTFAVLEGVAAASPTAPSPGSYAPVAEVRVNAGDGAVIAAQIVPKFVTTSLAVKAGGDVTVEAKLTGAPQWSGYFSIQNLEKITFETPFNEPPQLQVTGVFPSAAVQIVSVYSVTETGFFARVIRFGHSVPLAGVVTYRASEK